MGSMQGSSWDSLQSVDSLDDGLQGEAVSLLLLSALS